MPLPAPQASVNAAALDRDTSAVFAGVVIYGIGDLAHQGEVSGHNPDDYPPLRAELSDADNKPEYRAKDIMIGPKFTPADAERYVQALITGPDRDRIYYIIYNRTIYRRATGFQPEHYDGGDPHTNHVHVSTWVGQDENGAPWTSVLALAPQEDDDMAIAYKTPVGYFLGNGVHRRGPIGTSGPVFKPAIDDPVKAGRMMLIELTDAQRIASGSTSWDVYLDKVVGPLAPVGGGTGGGGVDVEAIAKAVNDDHARRMGQ